MDEENASGESDNPLSPARARLEELKAINKARAEAPPPPATSNGPAEPTAEEVAELDTLIARFSGQTVDLKADFQWAYLHCDDLNLSPKDATTPGAWSWYKFSKSNRAKFMEIATKQLLAKDENTKDNWKVDDGRVLKVIEKIKNDIAADKLSKSSVV